MDGPIRVLLVDDHPDILGLLRTNFQVAGFGTVEASNGQDALTRLDEGRPDVMVLDLLMPLMDGWEVLEALHDRPDSPPVIVLSAVDRGADLERAQRLGVSAYVSKPFDPAALVDLVRAVAEASDRVGSDPAEPSGP